VVQRGIVVVLWRKNGNFVVIYGPEKEKKEID
jgi:hypothetical protein